MTNSVEFIFGLACYLMGLGTAFYLALPVKWGTWLLVNAIRLKRENINLRARNKKLRMENEYLYMTFGRKK